jgi:arylsulfatase A-like enzyme
MDQHPLANRGPLAASLPLQAHLAAQGTRFTNAYTVLPICSPARASMLTGLYPHAHGLTENDGRFGGRAGLDAGDWMLHRAFSEAGYQTAWFGKWHLDNQSGAYDFGFEGWSLPGYGYPYASPEYADYLDRKGLASPVVEVELPGESLAPAGTRWALQDQSEWPEYEAGSLLLDGPPQAHEAFFVADLASNWIQNNAKHPFFLRVDPWGPHPPYMVPTGFRDRFGMDADFRPANFWSDLSHRPAHHTEYRDSWVGLDLDDDSWKLLAQRSMEQAMLVETALCGVLDAVNIAGVADETLIVVCADHGDAVASNGGVANKGSLLVEETTRIPLLLSEPGIPKGQRLDTIVSNLDIAPSLLAATGLTASPALHGENLGPLVEKGQPLDRSGVMLQHYGLHVPILQRGWRTEKWKLVVQEVGFQELYDLSHDPAELQNLACDPSHQATAELLQQDLFSQMARLGDTGIRQTAMIRAASSA